MALSEQQVFTHDPQATLDYTVDWSAWLPPGDTIAAAYWTIPAGLVQGQTYAVGGKVTAWLSLNPLSTVKKFLVTCSITTVSGRRDDRTIQLNILDR